MVMALPYGAAVGFGVVPKDHEMMTLVGTVLLYWPGAARPLEMGSGQRGGGLGTGHPGERGHGDSGFPGRHHHRDAGAFLLRDTGLGLLRNHVTGRHGERGDGLTRDLQVHVHLVELGTGLVDRQVHQGGRGVGRRKGTQGVRRGQSGHDEQQRAHDRTDHPRTPAETATGRGRTRPHGGRLGSSGTARLGVEDLAGTSLGADRRPRQRR